MSISYLIDSDEGLPHLTLLKKRYKICMVFYWIDWIHHSSEIMNCIDRRGCLTTFDYDMSTIEQRKLIINELAEIKDNDFRASCFFTSNSLLFYNPEPEIALFATKKYLNNSIQQAIDNTYLESKRIVDKTGFMADVFVKYRF